MKSRSLGKYLIYLIFIIGLYIIGTLLLDKCYAEARRTFIYNYWLVAIIKIIFYGGIGAVLGVDSFLVELKSEGTWKLDIPRLIILGIPSLILLIPYMMILIPFLSFYSSVFTISSIVFGYTMISSIYKEEEDVEQ